MFPELEPLTGVRHLRAIVRDVMRIAVFAVLVVVISQLDQILAWGLGQKIGGYYQPVFTMLSVTAGLCAFTHVTRRILFNQLDLQEIARRASSTPLGAGMVFASVCAVVSVVLLISALLLA